MIEEEKLSKELIDQLSRGDQHAFRRFYDYYYLRLYRFLSYFTQDPIDCEEILSEVFCIVWLKRERLSEIEFLDAYLYKVCRNETFRYLKKENRSEVEFIDDLGVILEYVPSNDHDPMLEKEMQRVYREAIATLPERCKLIFLMIREQKMSYREVAQSLSITEGTIEVQINNATKRILNHVQLYFPEIDRQKTAKKGKPNIGLIVFLTLII